MGKLRALKLGIIKGIQHNKITKEFSEKKSDIIALVISRLKCSNCEHASRSHTKVRAQYAGLVGEQLFKLLKETQNQNTGRMDECRFYYCDECQTLKCQDGEFHK